MLIKSTFLVTEAHYDTYEIICGIFSLVTIFSTVIFVIFKNWKFTKAHFVHVLKTPNSLELVECLLPFHITKVKSNSKLHLVFFCEEALRAMMFFWNSTAATMAFTGLANSAITESPAVVNILPWLFLMAKSTIARQALRFLSVRYSFSYEVFSHGGGLSFN